MGFLGVYRAVYDYTPQGEGELAITEGDILYLLEKSGEDDWWRAKKKASGDDDDEPIGLIPSNYIEEARPSHLARALYDYTRQTDEELSFSEDSLLEVFDISDPDWILVGLDGEYGFAPANYIDLSDDAPATPARPALSRRDVSADSEEPQPVSPQSLPQGPAAALAGIMHQRKASTSAASRPAALPPRPQYTPQASDDEDEPTPSLPARPLSQGTPSHGNDYTTPRSPTSPGIAASPPHNRATHRSIDDDVSDYTAGGFHLYNINEMVSVMGKRKKMPTTLGINLATGAIMIAPEKARDGPQQEWTAEKMTHYSIEGKHVFLELVRPSKSVDFHAGAKDTAQEIVGALGEMAGAVRAEGLREVIMAGSGQGQKMGVVLYDFMAQGDDEVSVAVDDEVIIIDDTKSEEWWQVRRLKNGKEGVVPSSYVEITGAVSNPSTIGINAGKSPIEQNRLEEQRLAREAVKDHKSSEVGPGMRLPERGSSLSARDNGATQQRNGRDSKVSESGQPRSLKSKPDPSKVRTWTDRSKSFSVEAQFLALKDGKINLHKMNGVKIAVPVGKMSVQDLEYVERITGVSLDEDKPLSSIKGQRSRPAPNQDQSSGSTPTVGATIEQTKTPEYDWFQFFLSCDVAVGLCERYAQTFQKDSMDESVLPDVDATVLRTLGLREGDIIKVMRYLDNKYSRNSKRSASIGDGDGDGEGGGGLFSGPGGALKNNTRKGRPAPAVQTNDTVDPKAFSQQDANDNPSKTATERVATPIAPTPTPIKKNTNAGFDDDAWDVKPAKQQAQPAPSEPPQQTSNRSQAQLPVLTGSLQELSLLAAPLEPTKVQNTGHTQQMQIAQPPQPPQPQPPTQIQQGPQPPRVTPAFFAGLNQQPNNFQQPQATGSFLTNPQFGSQQPTFVQQQPSHQNIARQRPIAPQFTQNQGSLMPPPPPRPLSAPQTAQQSAFGPPPLQPQMTGLPSSGSFQVAPLAPPGQSLAEMNQMRMQQQYAQQQQQMQPQMTGFGGQMNSTMPQSTGFGQFNGLNQQPNGFDQQIQPQQTGFSQQSFINGQMSGVPFADPRAQQFSPLQQQPTGFQGTFNPTQQYPQPSGINSYLPPALQPQKTAAMQPQQTGMNGFGQNFGQQPPVPPIPQQPTLASLQPQKTGPPPPVRFGVTGDTKKLMPQATGRRANLAAATPQNPFGFD